MQKIKCYSTALTLSTITFFSTVKNVFADLPPMDWDEPSHLTTETTSESVSETLIQPQHIIIGIAIILVIIIAFVVLSKMKKK